MESQFRCKCGNPVSSINQPCEACGNLGPHSFAGKSEAPAESTRGTQAVARRESYPVVETRDYSERSEASEPSPRMHDSGGDDDVKFPAGMRSRSPILDAIEKMGDESGEEYSRKRKKAESDADYEDEQEDTVDDEYVDEDQDEGEPRKGMSTGAIVATVVLVLLLVAAAVYVYYNFDSITAWLASPTVPEMVKPSQ